jgi:hypothetical protein
MLRPGGTVIWTRGYVADQDLRPQLRAWFAEAGFVEQAWAAEPTGYGVGVHKAGPETSDAAVPDRLFTFVR